MARGPLARRVAVRARSAMLWFVAGALVSAGAVVAWRAAAARLADSPGAYRHLVDVAALILPLSLAPLLVAGERFRQTMRARAYARALREARVELDDAGVTLSIAGAPRWRALWAELAGATVEPAAHGDPTGDMLALVMTPTRSRPCVARLPDAFDRPLAEIVAELQRRRAAAGPFRDGALAAPDTARAVDAWAFTAACAGRALPPGCFVVRHRGAARLGLLFTPWALLAREGDAYRRVPWAHVARLELGAGNPNEFRASDHLVLRDKEGRTLAEVPCRPLVLPSAAILDIASKYVYETRSTTAA